MLGNHNLTSSERSANRIALKQVHIHGNFDPATFFDYDIAVVELETEARLSKFVRTICLPKKNVAIPGSTGMVAGWGSTFSVAPGHLPSRTAYSTVLRESSFTIRRDDVCSGATGFSVNANETFCAGDGKGRSGICNGDSGSPFVQQGLVDGASRRWMATGLLSWGHEGCAQRGKFDYFTRVEPLVDWINEVVANN